MLLPWMLTTTIWPTPHLSQFLVVGLNTVFCEHDWHWVTLAIGALAGHFTQICVLVSKILSILQLWHLLRVALYIWYYKHLEQTYPLKYGLSWGH